MPNPSVWLEENNITKKLCPNCNEWKEVEGNYIRYKTNLVSGKPKYNSWCKKCVSIKQAEYHKETWGPDKLQFTAYKRTKNIRSYLSYLRSKAIVRSKECISLDALETLWFSQKGLCALTGWEMTMELGKGVIPTNCSIDRIDSTKGYVPGNVQLVCRAANVAKHDLSVNDFLNLCKAVIGKING